MKNLLTLGFTGLLGCALLFYFARGHGRMDVREKIVALTFDDGPHPPYTERVLEILATNDVKASFFLIGEQVRSHPETAKKIRAAGHVIGGHSSDWDSLLFKRAETIEAKLDAMQSSFAEVGVTNATLFRPPGGLLEPWRVGQFEARGLTIVSADVVVGDWKAVSAETIRDRVLKKTRPGSIIVLHDGGGDRSATLEALPEIILGLKARGYSFASVERLFY